MVVYYMQGSCIPYLARQDGLMVNYRSDSICIGDTEYRIDEMSKIPDKYIPKDDYRPQPRGDDMDVAAVPDHTNAPTDQPDTDSDKDKNKVKETRPTIVQGDDSIPQAQVKVMTLYHRHKFRLTHCLWAGRP